MPNSGQGKVIALEGRLASLRFKYYQILTENRTMAIALAGYRGQYPDKFDRDLSEKVDKYIFLKF
ncbi:MAG: hypothetical protein QXN66_04045 [Thermoplasmatales archaeon]